MRMKFVIHKAAMEKGDLIFVFSLLRRHATTAAAEGAESILVGAAMIDFERVIKQLAHWLLMRWRY